MSYRPRAFDRLPFTAAGHATPADHAAAALERLREQKAAARDAAHEEGQAAAARAQLKTLMKWTEKVPEPKTGAVDLVRFAIQRDLYSPALQAVPDMVVMKGTQVGVSTWAMRWCLFHVDTRGRTGLYVFPTEVGLRDYVRLRIDPLFQTPYLAAQLGGTDNTGMKAVGAGSILFRGSNAESGLMSADVDVLVLDEYDSLMQANIAEVEQRVTGPMSDGLIRRLGVPHHTEEGIHGEYLRSDQRVWNARCRECGTWNPMVGPEAWRSNVDMVREIMVCKRCREPLDVNVGEWVAKFPDRSTPGFHIPKLAVPGVDIAGVIRRSKKPRTIDRERWHRNELGWPWTSPDARLTKEQLLKFVDPAFGMVGGTQSLNLVTMGVDVAGKRGLNVTISEHLSPVVKRKLWAGKVYGFEFLDDLMIRYGVNFAAIDNAPEWASSHAFADRWAGQVMCVIVHDAPGGRQGPAHAEDPIEWNDEDRQASVNRTILLDGTVTLFREGNVVLPANMPNEPDDDWFREMGGLVRTRVEDDKGNVRMAYQKVGGAPFDYLMAEAYDVVATEGWYRAQGLGILAMRQAPAPAVDDASGWQNEGDPQGFAGEDDPGYEPGMGDDDEFGGGI